jgi:hypothetical protein
MERINLSNGYIDFNTVTGIETICGKDAHNLFFTIEKSYREMKQKPSKIAYEIAVIERLKKEISKNN